MDMLIDLDIKAEDNHSNANHNTQNNLLFDLGGANNGG